MLFQPISGIVDVVKDPLPIGNVPVSLPIDEPKNTPKMLPLDMALHKPNLPETETCTVNLKKDDLGLGITVAGYVCEKGEQFHYFFSITKWLMPFINVNKSIYKLHSFIFKCYKNKFV